MALKLSCWLVKSLALKLSVKKREQLKEIQLSKFKMALTKKSLKISPIYSSKILMPKSTKVALYIQSLQNQTQNQSEQKSENYYLEVQKKN